MYLFFAAQKDKYAARVRVNLRIMDLYHGVDSFLDVVFRGLIEIEELYGVGATLDVWDLSSELGELCEEVNVLLSVDCCWWDN